MLVIPLIERKRNGESLTSEEWGFLVAEYAKDRIPDYQMSALLMAAYLNGMSPGELSSVTSAMLSSGSRFEFGPEVPPRIDKHSTGGVGDKVSLVLAPLAASCGIAVPMMSGRGLGHTAGTIDKLESIPGFRTALTLDEARRQVERIGCAMISQTREIAPADGRLYALRGATGTIEAIPLIAASIMSKKLAEGLNGLVLDIKRGSGSFLPGLADGLELAETMIDLGEEHGCRTVALLTAMDRPLGRACGNALEMQEAIAALGGQGPDDLLEVVYALGSEMLLLGGVEESRSAARARLIHAIGSGAAREKFIQLVDAQGGDTRVAENPGLLPQAPAADVYVAPGSGYIVAIDSRAVGQTIVELGGGRRTKEGEIDSSVGFVFGACVGDQVARGTKIATVHARDDPGIAVGLSALNAAIHIAQEPPHSTLPLVSHRVTRDGVEVLA